MKITALGVGEAFEEQMHNTSFLIENDCTMLIDCGYSAVRQIWKYNASADFLDIIYISHFHADHYFGLPALLFRMKEDGRKNPLTIISHRGAKSKINTLMKMAYKYSLLSMGFKINFKEVKHGMQLKVNELELQFARTVHAVPNLAVKVSHNGSSVAFSGDGLFLKTTEPLYRDVDLLINECYYASKSSSVHATLKDVLPMAERNNVKKLLLVHIGRAEKEAVKKIVSAYTGPVKVIIPREGYQVGL